VAARDDNFELFRKLLNRRVNIHIQDDRMNNVLHYAVINENEEMVKMIMWAEAELDNLKHDKNVRGKTPE
jgi:ankyrin repeat protein